MSHASSIRYQIHTTHTSPLTSTQAYTQTPAITPSRYTRTYAIIPIHMPTYVNTYAHTRTHTYSRICRSMCVIMACMCSMNDRWPYVSSPTASYHTYHMHIDTYRPRDRSSCICICHVLLDIPYVVSCKYE